MSLNTIIISRGPKGEDGGAGGGDLSQTDINSLAKLNAILTDATLIDTADARLSDARTPTAHNQTLDTITDAGTAAAADVGDFATAAQGSTADSALQPGGALGTPSSGTLTNCTFPTLNQSTTGNAATATALETGRTINGVTFDGSQSITIGCDAVDVIGTISLAQGGTSSTTASGARTNLGLGASDDVTHGSLTTTGTVTAAGATFNGLVSQTGLGGSTYFGEGAGVADDLSSNNNVGIGFHALKSNTNGSYNTASGNQALKFNTTGSNNTASGFASLFANTTGNNNTASGINSLKSNTNGSYNTASGYGSLNTNTTGSYNAASGFASLFANTTGNNNTASGFAAGRYITDGTTANQTSARSVYIGSGTKALANGGDNEIVIGYNAIGAGSNSVVLGNDSITKTVLRGAVETNGTVRTGAYTVGTLPTPVTGMRCYVTDSNRAASTHFGSTVIAAAGGTNYTVPVFYDGTDWIIA